MSTRAIPDLRPLKRTRRDSISSRSGLAVLLYLFQIILSLTVLESGASSVAAVALTLYGAALVLRIFSLGRLRPLLAGFAVLLYSVLMTDMILRAWIAPPLCISALTAVLIYWCEVERPGARMGVGMAAIVGLGMLVSIFFHPVPSSHFL